MVSFKKSCVIITLISFFSIDLSQVLHAEELPAISQQEPAPDFIMQELQAIIEARVQDKNGTDNLLYQSTSRMTKNGSRSEVKIRYGSSNETAMLLSDAAGHITAAILLYDLVRPSASLWDFLYNIFGFTMGVVVGGWLFSCVYHPVINLFVKVFIETESDVTQQAVAVNKEALSCFIKNWHEYKPSTPVILHAPLDGLYAQYLSQGATLMMSDEDAAQMIKTIVSECMVAQVKI